MRLWSLHPKHLDAKGLVALWREALLAQKVLQGKTKGYRNHPQLIRFKNHSNPQAAIASYLTEVWNESIRRGYHFDKAKILRKKTDKKIPVTKGQLKYEHQWLGSKIKVRTPAFYSIVREIKIEPHPAFEVTPGKIEPWEKIK